MRFFLAIAVLAALAAPRLAAACERISGNEENDKFGTVHQDRHYTQGLRLTCLAGEDVAKSLPHDLLFGLASDRKIAWSLGQSIFTPEDLSRSIPDPTDRPYAGWLYLGADLLQETKGTTWGVPWDHLESREVLLGVVGPYALGEEAQNFIHGLLHIAKARGWASQLANEPGLVLSYDNKWRIEQPLPLGLAIDAIPEIGLTGGNVFTYAEAGAIVRLGRNLNVDYGPDHIRPSVSGTAWFDRSGLGGDHFGWYAFAGVQGRAIARNVFLDGSTFQSSASVDKNTLVADYVAGLAVYAGDMLKVDFTFTQRTEEFRGQRGDDHFGMITLAIGL